MTETYTIRNRFVSDTDDSYGTISTDELKQPAKRKIWCINFRNMSVVRGKLLGIDDLGQHVVVLEDEDVSEEGTAWAVPKDNIYYDKHEAEKGLFKAHLKYE